MLVNYMLYTICEIELYSAVDSILLVVTCFLVLVMRAVAFAVQASWSMECNAC